MFFYMKNKTDVAVFSATEDVNLKENSPVKIYVEDVTRRLLVDGIFLLGRQGGKIYEDTFPDCQEEDPTYTAEHRMCLQKGIFKYLPVEEYRPKYVTTSSYYFKRINVGINDSRGPPENQWTVSSKEPLQQPYAYPHYGPIPGIDYVYGAQDPLFELTDFTEEHSISNQLNLWIKSHLPTELDFTELEDRGFNIEVLDEEPQVGVKINEDDVTVIVNYTLEVTRSDKRFIVKEYFVEIDYNFNRLWTFMNRMMLADMYTLDNILIYNMFNESGDKISKTKRIESNPPNYKYDVIEVTDLSYDWKISQNYDRQYYRYRFIRENRAADASTVFTVPEFTFNGDPITWYCPNFQTAGAWFDPDEDDQYTSEFPFTSPQWYKWYSRGDKLETSFGQTASGMDACPLIEGDVRYHNEPDSKDFGPSWVDALQSCGNVDYDFTTGTSADDVGDVIVLIVGDQMDFPAGPKVPAPERYPASPILETGFGRVNDLISFRPVKCEPGGVPSCDGGDPCGNGYWKFNRPSSPEKLVEHCVQDCITSYWVPDAFHPNGGECKQVDPYCMLAYDMIYHVDHNGMCVPYNHPKGSPTIDLECPLDPLCPRDMPTYCGKGANPVPDTMAPSDNSIHKSVCCADAEGQCQDFILPKSEGQCGSYHEDWTYITEEEFCNEMDECVVGCCNIRGLDQMIPAQKYECAALCRDAGICECSGDLASCSGEFSWSAGQCDGSYEYIQPDFNKKIKK